MGTRRVSCPVACPIGRRSDPPLPLPLFPGCMPQGLVPRGVPMRETTLADLRNADQSGTTTLHFARDVLRSMSEVQSRGF